MVTHDYASSARQRSATVPVAMPPQRLRSFISPARMQQMTFMLPLIATCYSAILAALIARGFPGSTSLVILIELALLGTCAALCLADGLTPCDWPFILLSFGFIIIALVVSLINERPMVETLRAAAIIGLFCMVGQRMNYRTLDRLFFWVCTIVLAVLLFEILSLQAYVAVFQPAGFFAATRGMEVAQYNETGLFNNASGFADRFNFGLFSGPRTSSIFLEQISNANFACIEAMYLAVRGRALPKYALAIGLFTVGMILVTANSRFGSMLVFVTLAGYLIFPLLPRKSLPLASVAIAAGALIVIAHNINATGDDLQGRLAFAGRQFRNADIGFYLGLHADKALGEADSGYSYFVGTTTIFGMIMLWLFVNLTPRMDDAPSRRLGWGLIFYFFGQLLVSSTSLLSIKTAALLWVLTGCVRTNGRGTAPVETVPV